MTMIEFFRKQAAQAIKTPQKFCDFEDFFDPRIRHIVDEVIAPAYRRDIPMPLCARVWEWAMAHLALASVGMLDKTKDGIAIGAGVEPMIFSVARHVVN